MKPFFTDKTPSNNNITLLEGNQIVTDNTTCAEILNTFFIESVKNLEIDREMYVNKVIILDDPNGSIIEKFEDRHSILRISQEQFPPNSFLLYVYLKKMLQSIQCKNSKKAYQGNNTPPPPPTPPHETHTHTRAHTHIHTQNTDRKW